MVIATRLLRIVFVGAMLCVCFGCAVQPEVHELDVEIMDDLRIENLVLTKRVFLERGKEKSGFYTKEDTVDVIATSKFGKGHDIANLDCIIAGLHDGLEGSSIFSPSEFWKTVGNDKEMLKLAEIFDERYSPALQRLAVDYMVIAYHQRIDLESFFMEAYVAGGVRDLDREVAAALIVDMQSKRVIDAFEVEAYHHKVVGHTLVIIPLARFEYPEEDPCKVAGRRAAEAIARSLTATRAPRIAVVAAKTNPYSALSDPTPDVTEKTESAGPSTLEVLPRHHEIAGLTLHEQNLVKAEQGDAEAQLQLYWSSKEPRRLTWLCRSADHGLAEASYRIGRLYQHGQEGLPRDNARAYLWYRLASIGGHSQAKIELQDMLPEMSAEQIDEAGRLFHEWKPGQCESVIIGDIPSK
jgi:hypothetical protein